MNQEQALNDISVKVGRLEVMQENNTRAVSEMAASVQRLVDKLDKSDDVAKEALQSTKSAHHRIDGLSGEFKEMKTGQRWLIGIVLT
ncbi:hypothetical protein, partial [Paenibacillus thailandensis]